MGCQRLSMSSIRKVPSLYIYISVLFIWFYGSILFKFDSKPVMSQKALLLKAVGKPLVLGDRPVPQPGENQLLVKVLVAGRRFW